ncbi:hypothetical protein O4H49_09205 [Kiloniella laminariae]|uniref:Uncharacterized protein n=1 Tax=Kiloniella laminariae TaxID=454162 RepID=A0ABT4LIP7_9PROT|nr:hypothetical protein [Kiloniella laminariae]MCZ4280952.1 hypothetical protein [Kiloniella laminariae]
MALAELDSRKRNSTDESAGSKRKKDSDLFIKHYFSRISPEVAATFTDEQKHAIKQMFGAREIARHPVEFRRSIPFGRHRFYLIFLSGRERRAFDRLKTEGQATGYVAYALAGAFWLVPSVAIAAMLYFFS